MANSIITQLDMFNNNDDSQLPVPLMVANKWKFKLAYHVISGDYWYAAQDWIVGVGQPQMRSSEVWRKLKKRLEKADIELRTRCTQLPYKATNGKTYQMDYLTDEGLYIITQRIDTNSGIRDDVLEYLAKAGVLVDTMRLNPETAVNFGISAYAANKKAPVWIESRVMGTINRRFFTEVFLGILKENADFAHATDNIYRGTLGYSTEALRKRLGITNPKRDEIRDKLSIPALNALSTAEYLCALKLSQYADDETLPDNVVYATILEIAQAVGLENREIERIMNGMGLDYLTGLPLLKKGHYDYE